MPKPQFHLELQWIRQFRDIADAIPWTPVACAQLHEVFKQLSPYGKLALWKTLNSLQGHHIQSYTDFLKPKVREALTSLPRE